MLLSACWLGLARVRISSGSVYLLRILIPTGTSHTQRGSEAEWRDLLFHARTATIRETTTAGAPRVCSSTRASIQRTENEHPKNGREPGGTGLQRPDGSHGAYPVGINYALSRLSS